MTATTLFSPSLLATGILIVCDSLPNLSLIRKGGVCGCVIIDSDDVEDEGVVGTAIATAPVSLCGQWDRDASEELHEPVEQ